MRKAATIPNKLYFRIGEVASLLGVKPYVLRYWETEFPDIKPTKSKSGQRLYKRRDVETLMKIRELLYEERFTINGARKRLKEVFREGRSVPSEQMAMEFSGNGSNPKPAPAAATPPESGNRSHQKLLVKIRKDLELLLKTLTG